MDHLPDTLTTAQVLGAASIAEATLPCINAKLTDSALCRAVAANLPEHTLFRVDDEYLTVALDSRQDNAGTVSRRLVRRPMTPARLCSWIEQHITFRDGSAAKAERCSLNKLQAEKILASDALLAAVPVIREICDVRLPMWGPPKDGKRTLRIAPIGYDPETQVYTADVVPWDPSRVYRPDAVIRGLHNTLRSFPWAEEQEFRLTRSVSAFMAYMIGQFCRHLIDRHPIVVINGNQPGTGKTLLAAMGLSPVFGNPDVSPYPQDDDALSKMLFSQLVARQPYVLIVDLFATDKATERNISNPLTTYTFARADWRAPLLAALWSLTRHWEEAGCPELIAGSKMPSFESFAAVAGSIVGHAGFCSPFGPREVGTDAGDSAGRALEQLLASIATEIEPEDGMHTGSSLTLNVEEILDRAEKMDIVDIITTAKEKKRSMGQILRKLKGRAFVDTRGRRFEFGRRKDAAGSKYPFIITSEPPEI